jgi:hypothetical protein
LGSRESEVDGWIEVATICEGEPTAMDGDETVWHTSQEQSSGTTTTKAVPAKLRCRQMKHRGQTKLEGRQSRVSGERRGTISFLTEEGQRCSTKLGMGHGTIRQISTNRTVGIWTGHDSN